jgi:hypothetical protein
MVHPQPGIWNPIHPPLQKVNCFDINLLDSVNSEMQLSLARDTVRG